MFFYFVGTKLSKDAVKRLFETLVLKARVLLQQALLVLSLAAFRIYGALVSFWVDSSAKYISEVGTFDKQTTTTTTTVSLISKT